jgi:hypothetical protein
MMIHNEGMGSWIEGDCGFWSSHCQADRLDLDKLAMLQNGCQLLEACQGKVLRGERLSNLYMVHCPRYT